MLLILIRTTFTISTFSQEERNTVFNSAIEDLVGNESESEESFADMLRSLWEDPVKINTADPKEISRLFFLTGFQVAVLCDYIKKNGKIVSVYEIANIPGFDTETAKLVASFITLDNSGPRKSDSLRINHRLIASFSQKQGTKMKNDTGPPGRALVRYHLTAGKISCGITMEKDPGELILSGRPRMPDFTSVNISFSGSGNLKTIIAGDFTARFGLGLALNPGSYTAFSLTQPGNLSGSNSLRPYSSADETNFFRGVAINASVLKTDITLFASVNNIDATVASQQGTKPSAVSNIDRSGLHNTATALLGKDNLKDCSYGLSFVKSFRKLNAGIMGLADIFSIPFVRSSNSLSDLYDFTGTENFLVSGWYSLLAGKFIFSGELCSSPLKGYGIVQTLAFHPADRLTLNIVLRDISDGFSTFHGRSPVSGNSSGNERAVTGSFNFELARYLFLSAGSDIRTYSWLRYRCSEPSVNLRNELRLKYIPGEKMNFDISFNYRRSFADRSSVPGVAICEMTVTSIVKMQARISLSDRFILTPRVDLKFYRPGQERGFSYIQDFLLKLPLLHSSLWMRYCIYSTDSFFSGIYAWENDLLNSFSVPVLYGKGSRFCVMWNADLSRSAAVRIKYGLTSSGGPAGNSKGINEIKLQLILRM